MTTTTTEDPRRGLPSASSIHRLAACPGSHRMCQGIPDRPSDDSSFGTHIHEYLAGRLKESDLTAEELDIAESCQKIEAKVVAQWKARYLLTDEHEITVTRDTERLWLNYINLCIVSGVADVVYRYKDVALVLDYKTLPGDHADSNENLQLRCLACLVDAKDTSRMAGIDVAIIQPLVTHSPTVATYDAEALKIAHEELNTILHAAKQEDAPLVAGEQCRFCRANAVCPESRKGVETFAALTINATGLVVSDQDIAALLDRCGAATKVIAAIKAEAYRRAEADPETWRKLGFEIQQGSGKRSVSDVQTVSERLNAAGASWNDIAAGCSISIKNTKALTRAATGLKGMALDKTVTTILDGCTTVKPPKPSLVRIGAPSEESEGGEE